jgi:hypothetical protein
MNTTTAYTPLESLLLFQSLAAWGTEPDVFIKTSNLLKSNLLVRDGDTYDAGRLSPDALRELYLQLLREELRIEASQGETRGDASPSKKRKLQSPPLPTIKDANQYSEKLPQLVERLYARYRDYIVRLIREDERKYQILQREMAEIERGEWDERYLKEERARSNRTPSVASDDTRTAKAASSSPLSAATTLPENKHTAERPTISTPVDGQLPHENVTAPPPTLPLMEAKPKGLGTSDMLDNQKSGPTTAPDSEISSSNPLSGPAFLPSPGHQRASSHEKLHTPSPLQAVQQEPSDDEKLEQYQGVPPAQPQPPFQPNQNYAQYPPSQYQQHPPGPPRGSFPVPSGHVLPSPQGHIPSSPLNSNPQPTVLPPSNIAPGPISPSAGPLDQLADVAGQQYRAPTASPLAQQHPIPGTPSGQQYPPYPPQYRTNDVRPPSGNGAPAQWNAQYPSPFGLPTNYNYPQQPPPAQRPFQVRPDILQPEQRQYTSPYNPSQGPLPINASASTPRPLHLRDMGSLPHTPASLPRNSTGRATRWTPNPTASTPKAPKSPIQPTFEPLSPVLAPVRPAKTPKTSNKGKKKNELSTVTLPRAKGQRGPQRAKAGSPASSAVAGSQRSQSILSHADDLSLPNDGVAARMVKQESATPRTVDDIEEITVDEMTNRTRRGTVRGSPARVTKRKRQESPAPEPSGPSTHVLWTRNFPKISASALERIAAHRHASIFAQPIKERDAPGYKHLILRPQDLKSIRAAINTGYKAGLATVSTMGDQGQASMMLPISEEIIPPKGIVNNAQLEKELMRMFANAIMFNHDPNRSLGKAFEVTPSIEETAGGEGYEVDENGVVRETIAMYADVEKIVGEMRSAEWRKEEELGGGEAEEDEVDQLAGEGDSAMGGLPKRRRRA